MKKIMLIAMASLFSLGVMAQTAPAMTSNNSKSRTETRTTASKNNPKKTKSSRSHSKSGPSTSKHKKGTT